MLKQHLSFRRATMAAAAIALTTPMLVQGQQEQQEQQRRQQEQQRQQQQQQQRQQQGQQGQPSAALPDEVRQVLTSLDGTWTVEGTFFAEENGDAEVSHRMNGTANRKWILNNNILQSELKLHAAGQGMQPGQREPGQPGDMSQPDRQTQPGQQPDRQTQPGQQPRPGQQQQPGQAASAGLEGMWLLGYDTANDEYTSAWMDSKSPAIRCDTGRWESSERKLIFEGEYTKPETDDTVATRVEVQIQTDNRHVVTMFEDPGLLDAERRAYMLTFIREGGQQQPGQQQPGQPRPGQQQPGQQGQQTSLRGQVTDFSEAQIQGMDAQNKTFARVRLQDGESAILCFDQQVQVNQLGISSGDDITVRGRETQMGGQTVITVESLTANGRPVQIPGQRPGAQRPGQQPAAPGQQPGGAAGDLTGQVTSFREAQVPGMDAANKTFAHVRLQNGQDAYLAFDQNVDINALNISAGDEVTIKGSKTDQGGRTVINVESIEVNGRPVEITGN